VNPSLQSGESSNADLLKVNVVAVLPLRYEMPASAIASNGSALYEELVTTSKAELLLDVVPARDVLKALKADHGVTQNALQPEEYRGALGQFGADAVLAADIHRYTERVGSRVSADVPAGVDFSMALVRIGDGKELWRASYFFQDQALSENLFRLGKPKETRPGKWHTASELLSAGFQKAVAELAARRTAAFTGQN